MADERSTERVIRYLQTEQSSFEYLSQACYVHAPCCHSASASQVVANGSCHSLEGIKLEELALRAGDAKLLVRA